MENKLSKSLTWDDLANEYDKVNNGRKARTMEMNEIFEWAKKQTNKFKVSTNGTIHKIMN